MLEPYVKLYYVKESNSKNIMDKTSIILMALLVTVFIPPTFADLNMTFTPLTNPETFRMHGFTNTTNEVHFSGISPNGTRMLHNWVIPNEDDGSYSMTTLTNELRWSEDGFYNITAFQGTPKNSQTVYVEILDMQVVPEFGENIVMFVLAAGITITLILIRGVNRVQ